MRCAGSAGRLGSMGILRVFLSVHIVHAKRLVFIHVGIAPAARFLIHGSQQLQDSQLHACAQTQTHRHQSARAPPRHSGDPQ